MSTTTTPVSWLLRSGQAFFEQICQSVTLDHGVALFSERYPQLCQANQLREVLLEDSTRLPEAFARTEEFYTARGVRCGRWVPALEQPLEPLDGFLPDHGFARRDQDVWVLTRWVEPTRSSELRVVPARAVRAAFRETFSPVHGGAEEPEWQAYCERLDDPQLDMFVALVDGQSAGRCGLFQRGDVARIIGLHSCPQFEGLPVERTLVQHCLQLAKRLGLSQTCTKIAQGDESRSALFEAMGFGAAGVLTEYVRPLS